MDEVLARVNGWIQVEGEGLQGAGVLQRQLRRWAHRRLPCLVRLRTPQRALQGHELVPIGEDELRRQDAVDAGQVDVR